MAAPQVVKNTINIWMNSIGLHAYQALSEFTTLKVMRELSPSGTVTFIDTVTSTGACFFPLITTPAQIITGLSIQTIKMGIQPPDKGKAGAAAFQAYARKLLTRSREQYAKNLHKVANYQWHVYGHNPHVAANIGKKPDVETFLVQLMQSTFKPKFILNAQNNTFNGTNITMQIKSNLKTIYRRVEALETRQLMLRLPGLFVLPKGSLSA